MGRKTNYGLDRGIRVANAPPGLTDVSKKRSYSGMVDVVQSTSDKPGLSGVVRYRFRSPRDNRLPAKVNSEQRSSDRFGNPVFPFTGTGSNVLLFDTGSWYDRTSFTAYSASAVPVSHSFANAELGMYFSVDRPGYVTHLRFYLDTASVGPHTGSLWTYGGVLLTRAPFSSGTAPVPGWQDVMLTSSVLLSSGTQYIVSYGTNNGFAYADPNLIWPIRVPPIFVVSTASFFNGAVGSFPNTNKSAVSYMVDVGFDVFPSSSSPLEPGVFPLTGSGQGPVSRYCGGVLPDGRIMIAGGISGSAGVGVPRGRGHIFNTGTSEWITTTLMANVAPAGFSQAAGVTLLDGRFLVMGGSGSTGTSQTGSYLFLSASDNSWVEVNPGTVCKRRDFQVARLQDGRVFVPGGQGLSGSIPFTGSEIFDPTQSKWFSSSGTYPPIPLYPYDREGYTLNVLNDGTVLLVGGRDPVDGQSYPHVLRFTPNVIGVGGSTGSWSIEPSMSLPRSNHTTTKLGDGKVLICGGTRGTQANLQVFLPLYLGGQFNGGSALNDVEIYDPMARTVRYMGQMLTPRAWHAASWLAPGYAHEGRVIVCGGEDSGFILSSSEVYDVEFNTWRQVQPLPVAVSKHMMFQVSGTAPYTFVVPGGELTSSIPNLVAFSGTQVYTTTG